MNSIQFLMVGIFLSFITCKASDKYKFENDILDCFYEQYQEAGIDVKSIVDSLESFYIKYGILESGSGESYTKLIKSLGDSGYLALPYKEGLKEDIQNISYIPSGISCSDSVIIMDTVKLNESKLKYVMGIFDSIANLGDISTRFITEKILEVLNEEDFEQEFYRSLGLIMLTNLYRMNDFGDREQGALRMLPRLDEKDTVPIKKINLFEVYINRDDKIMAEGNIIELSELRALAKKFILETSEKEEVDLPLIGKQLTSKGIISLKNDWETSYQMYINVQNELAAAYNEIRDDYARKFFNMEYDKLDGTKRDIIDKLVPMRISEAEPE